ncbi:SA1362 family protein [Fervidibacillus halotolerans]|uniref:Uncharacterized protein n=1 Tax=Fervidibacillus halotolerans TaxID=2980027 RepID=A0A9E8RXR2_9BACI|nr:SA1362 family protein [Fervidibacillus halotolerans]WAA11433.1 hypothetical protein OE105_07240 [Fervidibacillus halotolerans]
MRAKTPIFVYILLLLALLGFIALLQTNPHALVRYLLGTVIVIFILLLLFKYISPTNMTRREEDRAFAKAAKYSKKRMKKLSTNNKKKAHRSKHALRRNRNHLTVIEGKKGKKKSRALH